MLTMTENEKKRKVKEMLREAMKATRTQRKISSLKARFPGSEQIPERVAALLTDRIPSLSTDMPLLHEAISASTAALDQALGEWHQGQIREPEVLYRFVTSLIQATLELNAWDVVINTAASDSDTAKVQLWDYRSHGRLIDHYHNILAVRPRRTEDGQAAAWCDMPLFMQELLSERDRRMMGIWSQS